MLRHWKMQSGQTSLTTGQTGRHITRQRDQRYGNRQVGGATVMCRNVRVLLCCFFVVCFYFKTLAESSRLNIFIYSLPMYLRHCF